MGCHCWLVQQCEPATGTPLLDKPTVAPCDPRCRPAIVRNCEIGGGFCRVRASDKIRPRHRPHSRAGRALVTAWSAIPTRRPACGPEEQGCFACKGFTSCIEEQAHVARMKPGWIASRIWKSG